MKNTLKLIIAVVLFVGVMITVYFTVIKDQEEESKEEKERIDSKTVELGYLVDDFVGYYEPVELTDKEKEELTEIFESLDYENEKIDVELSIVPQYKLTIGDKTLYLSDDDEEYGDLVQKENSEIIETKNLKAKIKSYMEAKTIETVYLFERKDLSTTNFKKIELEKEDKELIKQYFSYETDIEPVNLMIAGQYVLVVDGDSLAFDDVSGHYAMHGDEMVLMNGELAQILDKYVQEDCCSCCPDLKPGEVCIDMCCPCN